MYFDEPPQFMASNKFRPIQDVSDQTVIVTRRKIMGHYLNFRYHIKDDTLHVKRSDLKELCEKARTTLAATVPKLNSKIILE